MYADSDYVTEGGGVMPTIPPFPTTMPRSFGELQSTVMNNKFWSGIIIGTIVLLFILIIMYFTGDSESFTSKGMAKYVTGPSVGKGSQFHENNTVQGLMIPSDAKVRMMRTDVRSNEIYTNQAIRQANTRRNTGVMDAPQRQENFNNNDGSPFKELDSLLADVY